MENNELRVVKRIMARAFLIWIILIVTIAIMGVISHLIGAQVAIAEDLIYKLAAFYQFCLTTSVVYSLFENLFDKR